MDWKPVGDGQWALYGLTLNAAPIISIVRRDGDLNDAAPKYCLAGGGEYDQLAEAKAVGEAALPDGSLQVEFRHGPAEGLRVVQATPSHYVIVDSTGGKPIRHVYTSVAAPPGSFAYVYDGAEEVV